MAVVSQIHIGLAGWSNATYAVGARRANAVNAYQCITAGTSTSPPTGTGSNIAPGGTAHWKWLSAIDFTTLQAWADSLPSTLTAPQVGTVWSDGVVTATAGVTLLTLSGHTTSSTNTITLVPATGEGILSYYATNPTAPWVYNATNGFAINLPATGFGGVNYIQINDTNVHFLGLQIKDLNASSGATIIGGSGQVWIDKCLIEGQTQSGGARMFQLNGSTGNKVTNSLIIDHSTASGVGGAFECNGAGLAIANSTFVKITPVTGSSCLDANSNATNASNTVQNCIFVGWDEPFVASSNQPWATNNNAYTNATFTSTGNATDLGGSVFGATASTLFVAATTDYHQNPTSPCLNAGVTDTTDIASADDFFGVSRPQGASWDIGPHELLAATAVFRDTRCAVELLSTVSRSDNSIAAWGMGLQRADTSGIAWLVPLWMDHSSPIEILSLLSLGPNFPVSWQSGVASTVRDISVPLEWLALRSRSVTVQDAWSASLLVDRSYPIGIGHLSRRDAVFLADALSSLPHIGNPSDFSSDFGVDFGIVPYVVGPNFQVSWLTARRMDSIVPYDFSRTIAANTILPAEWGGHLTISSDLVSPVEWRATFVSDTVFPLASSAVLSGSHAGPIEFGRGAARNVTVPVDAKASPLRDGAFPTGWQNQMSASLPFPVEFGLSVRVDHAAPTEFMAARTVDMVSQVATVSQLRRDITSPIEPLLSAGSDTIMPLGIGGGIAFSAHTFPVSWRVGVSSDAVVPAEILSSLPLLVDFPVDFGTYISRDASSPVAFSSATYRTLVAPLDWDHLLIHLTIDATFALETLATVHSDLVVPINMRVGQKAIGAQLEPDEFEREHEP